MELFDAILNRRTIKDFKPDPVLDAVLERVLTAGLWAQNHRMTLAAALALPADFPLP